MIAFLDTPSGISGDMFLGCLVDAGWAIEALQETVQALNWQEQVEGLAWSVEQREVKKGALRATQVVVHASAQEPHRHLSDIRALLEGSRLPAPVIEDALAVFTRLAEAEGAVHGMSAEDVHFHEVGALDSIIDIVGVCAGIHALGITTLYASALPMGLGFTQSQHGQIPLPAPATLELLAQAHAPIKPAPGKGEFVTPTGAALITHFVAHRWQQPEMLLHKIAIGAGQKEFPWPNIARLWIGARQESKACFVTGVQSRNPKLALSQESKACFVRGGGALLSCPVGASPLPLLSLLETNIDDMNPELYASIMQNLFTNGARDAWLTAIQMKKNRPATKLSVLTLPENEATLANLLLQESTTLGIRVHQVRRYQAPRRIEQLQTPFGAIPIKLKLADKQIIGAVPEFDACQQAAIKQNVSTRQVYEAAAALAWQKYLSSDHFINQDFRCAASDE